MNPGLDAFVSLISDLELHGALSFPLHYRCAGTDMVTYADVLHAQTG